MQRELVPTGLMKIQTSAQHTWESKYNKCARAQSWVTHLASM